MARWRPRFSDKRLAPELGDTPVIWTTEKGNFAAYRFEVVPKSERVGTRLAPIKLPNQSTVVYRSAICLTRQSLCSNWMHLHVYSIWPLRHYLVQTELGEIRGRKFNLNLEEVFKQARYWTPKRTREWAWEREREGKPLPRWAKKGEPGKGPIHPCRALVNTVPPRIRRVAHQLRGTEITSFLRAAYKNEEVVALIEQMPILGRHVIQMVPATTSVEKRRYLFGAKTWETAVKRALRMKRADLWYHCYQETPTKKQLKAATKMSIRGTYKHLIARDLKRVADSKITSHLPYLPAPTIRALDTYRSGHWGEHTKSDKEILEKLPMSFWLSHMREARFVTKGGNERRSIGDIPIMLDDVDRLSASIRERNAIPVRMRVAHIRDLKEWHDVLTDQLNALKDVEFNMPFQHKPPVEGTEEIIPLTSPKLLKQEGREMHHCVASYDNQVKQGNSYIYSVRVGGDKATLELVKRGNVWKLAQCRSVCNKHPVKEIWDVVNKWMEENEVEELSDNERWW